MIGNSFPHKIADCSILDSLNNIKYKNIKGTFESSYVKIFENNNLSLSPNDLIVKKLSNGSTEKYRIVNSTFKEKGLIVPSHYYVEFKPYNSLEPTFNINIDTQKLAEDFSKAMGINNEIVQKLLDHQNEIKILFQEQNFLSADSLSVVKTLLEKSKNDNNKLDIEKILNILGIFTSIYSSLK